MSTTRIDNRPRKTERRHGLALRYRILLSVKFRSKSGCWEWRKSLSDGYGRLRVNGKLVLAHRLSYEIFIGESPGDLMVCHHCDKRCCCNPWHLFLGDNSVNQKDRVSKGRWSSPFDLRGENHPNSKLTTDDIRSIRQLASTGETQGFLASKFSVSQSLISLIIRKRKWRHV